MACCVGPYRISHRTVPRRSSIHCSSVPHIADDAGSHPPKSNANRPLSRGGDICPMTLEGAGEEVTDDT
eukprot:1054628-Rhodomonas_salina.2